MGPVVVLAGGTGGAKLARGLLDEADELTVIANTGDDVEVYGAYVSPDPDLVTFWLADRIDERGWGLAGDTFAVMDGLRELGDDVWFNLGDRDLALCLRRARRLAEGARLTEAIDEARQALGVRARVLPMCDEPVRTHVTARGRSQPFQDFMIRERGAGPVEGVELRGIEAARPTPEVLDAIARADAIVVGPSNPVISIGPSPRPRIMKSWKPRHSPRARTHVRSGSSVGTSTRAGTPNARRRSSIASVSRAPAASRPARCRPMARSRSPRLNHTCSPSARSWSIAANVSPARPQPRSSMASATQNVIRSGSGDTWAP